MRLPASNLLKPTPGRTCRWGIVLCFLWIGILLFACNRLPVDGSTGLQGTASAPAPSSAWTQAPAPTDTSSPSPVPTITSTSTGTPIPPTPTRTTRPSATPSPTVTPPPPPGLTTRLLRPYVSPTSYLADSCQYLRLRWSLEGSPPDTVVVPIMFHGIREAGRPIRAGDNVTVSEESFLAFVAYARQLGFQTVTSEQLIDFLSHNAPIPRRSMILIVDDRNIGTVENHFLPVLEENDWTVTMGWIVADTNQSLWERVERLNETGRADVQSHGLLHRYMTDHTPEEEIREEITGPIEIWEQRFGKRPVTFVWPGGNFTPLTVQIARQAGYKLAFTVNTNGPLLFNWIPLREAEIAVGDPLMVLPRYWSSDASLALDQALKFADQARSFAVQSYAAEAAWYSSVCAGELPPLEAVLPEAIPTENGAEMPTP